MLCHVRLWRRDFSGIRDYSWCWSWRDLRRRKFRLTPTSRSGSWIEGDYQPSAAVITASYRGHVDAQINDQYHTLSGSLRFLNNIVRFPDAAFSTPNLHLLRSIERRKA